MRTFRIQLVTTVLILFISVNCIGQVVPVPPVTDTIVDESKENTLDNVPVVSLDESDNLDGSAQNISGAMNNGRNPFSNAASFNFNVVRFRVRGYDADMFNTYMNGAPMINLDNGFTPFGLWSGLNDVIRNRDSHLGLQATKYAIGDFGGSTFMDTRAFKQRKQTSISYAYSNRLFVHRLMFTHSSGWTKKNWAYSISATRRQADEGFTDGTYYDGYSFYTGVDKKINDKHILSFVAFATPTENGRQGSSVQEMLDIAGTNFYNPYWGYQNGKKRNSSVAKVFQPVGILTHQWTISPASTLLSAVTYSTGKRSTTGLDWFNTNDPRPDYYRYLPSYYADDSTQYNAVLNALKNDVNKRQINWDALYNANYASHETIHNANGIAGNDISGRRSVYIVENRVTHTNRLNASTTYNTTINKHIDLTAGLSYEYQDNHYYKEVNDLLGGDFYVDINQYAERDFPNNQDAIQNDLNSPNRILKVGDKFGYNYNIKIQRASGWAQAIVKLRKVDFFVSAEHSFTTFKRIGNTKTGLFSHNSFGSSDDQNFYNYSVKTGASYLFAPRNYFYLNGGYQTKAPFFDNAYISPRTRDNVQDNLVSEKIATIEGGYVMIAPVVKIRLTGYLTDFKNGVNVLTFYDDEFRNFVNYAISNIGKRNMGVEFGSELLIKRRLTLSTAAAIGKYRYTTRQNATVTLDNSSAVLANQTVYSKNYYVPTPQQAYTIGLNYRSRKFWWVGANFNYFDDMWLDFNPIRRSESAVNGIDPSSEKWHEILDQEKLKAQYTLDANAGWSWLMSNKFRKMKRTFLVFTLGVSNILNNKNIVSGGYEQLRFDFVDRNVDKFPPKRFYAYGTTFNASVALRF